MITTDQLDALQTLLTSAGGGDYGDDRRAAIDDDPGTDAAIAIALAVVEAIRCGDRALERLVEAALADAEAEDDR